MLLRKLSLIKYIYGSVMINKRLRNALRDVDMDNTKVGDLLVWMSNASGYFAQNNDTGATIVYKIRN